MSAIQPLVTHVSDTALWAAAFRARETERGDALFRDPFAARLAGSRGFAMIEALSEEPHQEAWAVRTYLFDHYIRAEVENGVDTVLNLAAGLDARPYRLTLPACCRWIDVDLPDMLAYKEAILANERAGCDLSRIALDLQDTQARRRLFEDVSRHAGKVLILTEGLLIYLSGEEVANLAADLAIHDNFHRWVLELTNPKALRTIQASAAATHLGPANTKFKFGPAEGPGFFADYGWTLMNIRGFLKTLVALRRAPIDHRMVDLVPEWPCIDDSVPWAGVAMFGRQKQLQLFPEEAPSRCAILPAERHGS